MSMEVLQVTERTERGTKHARRMRAAGQIPAVLYGHGGPSVSLTLQTAQVEAAVRHSAHLVQLQGAASGNALLRDLQWDALGSTLLHVDLTRIEAGEAVTLTLPVMLRGEAPGAHAGGLVELLVHELEVRCPATAIPQHIEVNINHLELGNAITAVDLAVPDQVELLVPAETVIVTCGQAADEEEAAATSEGAEPEVIRRAAEEGEAGED